MRADCAVCGALCKYSPWLSMGSPLSMSWIACVVHAHAATVCVLACFALNATPVLLGHAERPTFPISIAPWPCQACCVEFLILEGDNLGALFPAAAGSLGPVALSPRHLFVLLAALAVLPTMYLRDLSLLSYVSGTVPKEHPPGHLT